MSNQQVEAVDGTPASKSAGRNPTRSSDIVREAVNREAEQARSRRGDRGVGGWYERFVEWCDQRWSEHYRDHKDEWETVWAEVDQARFEATGDEYLARARGTVIATTLTLTVVGVIGGGIAGGGVLPAVLGGVLTLVGVGVGSVQVAQKYPRFRAYQRRQQIDRQLPDAVMAMYSLSQSGMGLPEIVSWIATSEEIGEEVSVEFQMITNEIETFGVDLRTAIQETRDATPSEDLRSLLDDMESSLESEQSIGPFLSERAERFNRRRREQTTSYLETINNLSETFLGFVVVGGTALIALLTIVDMNTIGGIIPTAIGAIVYVLIPLAGVAMIVTTRVLSPFTPLRQAPEFELPDPEVTSESVGEMLQDGEDDYTALEKRGLEQLGDGLEAGKDSLGTKLKRAVRLTPEMSLIATVPAVIAYLGVLTVSGLASPTPSGFLSAPVLTTAAVVGVPIGALMIPISVLKKRRQEYHEEIESQLPDVLDRMARITESGQSLSIAIGSVAREDGNRLEQELEGVRKEMEYSTSLSVALKRMSNRVQNQRIARTVRILVESNTATGYVHEVLQNIHQTVKQAADARQTRQVEMEPHIRGLVVGFAVYLVISAFFVGILLPNVEMISELEAQATAAGVTTGGTGVGINTDVYRVLLLHGAIIQSVVYGGLAGELRHGDVFRGSGLILTGVAVSIVTFGVI
ncbi:type II secretion system F family protein [Halorubrum pallidum]|uniref:Type II secretion system F family protein n=1 Tax=Halorubrum pallidum TaxID=1526114 RepID=A0ABD5SXU2_9EURY